MLVVVIVGLCVVSVAANVWQVVRSHRREAVAAEAMRLATEELEQLRGVASAVESTQRALATETGLLLEMTLDRDKEKRRADRFFELIEGIVAERDQWESIYKQQSRAAGGAQAMLLLALGNAVEQSNRLVRALREHGVEARELSIDPALETTVREFAARHPKGAAIARSPGVEAAARIQAEFLDVSKTP